MVYPRKSNDSSGGRQSRVWVSFTVSFSFDFIPCIAAIASSAVPRQQITKSSASLTIHASRRRSWPPVFHPYTKRRMSMFDNKGEVTPPTILQTAPIGALSKRERADLVHHAHLLGIDLHPLD